MRQTLLAGPRAWLQAIGVLLAVATAFAGSANAQEKSLFNPAASPSAGRQANALANVQANRAVTSVQVVAADVSALEGATVVVPLPGAGGVRIERLNVRTRGAADYTWHGRVQFTGTQATLTVRGDSIEGTVWVGTQEFVIRSLGDGLHAIGRIDSRALPQHHPRTPPVAPRLVGPRSAAPSAPLEIGLAGTVVDVLVAYTPEALAANATIAQMAQSWIDTMNQAYANSNANVELRLAGTYLISGYTEPAASTGAAGYEQILNDATNGTLAPMAALHAERNRVGADMVSVLIKHPSYCGLAWINSDAADAFSVVTHTCGALTFGHELGHNFGALHDHVTSPEAAPYAYGHGHFYQSQWRTIMSYSGPCNGCPRIPYFSNPSLNYNSVPLGTVTVNDVARVHRERVATVAAFRSAPMTPAKGAITAPAQGSTLASSSATFSWTQGTSVQAFWLYAGSSTGASNYHDSGQLTSATLTRTISTLPTNATTVYIRLWSQIAGAWQFNDYTYTASGAAGAKGAITSPTAGSTLPGSSATFNWTQGTSVQAFWLYVGSSTGAANYHDSGQLTAATLAVSALPTNGTKVYVRLWSLIGGAWQSNDYTYTAANTGAKGAITSPSAGSTLPGSSATFNWTQGTGVQVFWLYVGSGSGAANYHDSGQLTSATLSRTISTLPTNGGAVYVRLWSLIGGAWLSNDYVYNAAAAEPPLVVR